MPMPMLRPHRLAAAACGGVLLALAGCAHLDAPAYEDLYAQALGTSAMRTQWHASSAPGQFQPQWLGFEAHGELRGLIEEALAHSPSLRATAHRLEQARGQMRLTGADLPPSVAVGGKYANSLQPANSMALNGYAVALSWELDLWARVRAQHQAGQATFRSVQADYVFARQSLAAMTARAWVGAIDARGQAELSAQVRDARREQRALMHHRRRIGQVPAATLAALEAQVQSLEAAALRAEHDRQQALRTLELLLGRYPTATLAVPARLPGGLTAIPSGVPADVIERRPDLLAARQRYVAAYYQAHQARAARLPRVALTAGAGHLSADYLQLKDLVGSAVYPVGGTLLWPLLDGGRLSTAVQIADQQRHAAVADYAAALLAAWGEVEAALAAEADLQQREHALTRQVAALEQVVQAAHVQLRIGQIDRFALAEHRIDLAAAQSAQWRLAAERRVQRIHLHLALGGDFGVPPEPGLVAVDRAP